MTGNMDQLYVGRLIIIPVQSLTKPNNVSQYCEYANQTFVILSKIQRYQEATNLTSYKVKTKHKGHA